MIYLINEDGNAKLKGKSFNIPKNIRKHLQHTLDNFKKTHTNFDVEGFKRLNNILGMDAIEYGEMKRLNNYFDTYVGDGTDDTFILNGGEPMKLWLKMVYSDAKANAANQKEAEEFEKPEPPKIKKEKRTVTQAIPAPTKITISSETPSVDRVNSNDLIHFDSVVSDSKIDESHIIRITEAQVKRLKRNVLL